MIFHPLVILYIPFSVPAEMIPPIIFIRGGGESGGGGGWLGRWGMWGCGEVGKVGKVGEVG